MLSNPQISVDDTLQALDVELTVSSSRQHRAGMF